MTQPESRTASFVERLLADKIGLDVGSVGEGLIHRGVQARMKQLGVRRLEDYQRILAGPSDEIQGLIEEVVIPESWFFRDDRPFETFRNSIRTGWVNDAVRPPVSVLCLPCAGGEEPYSVVIALLELGLPRERFEVVAVDISERSIRRAAVGIYGVNAFRGLDPRIQATYFDPTETQGRYLLKPSVRSAVRFEQGNLLDMNLLVPHPSFDIVFCRNLLIYFDDVARSRAFSNLDRLTTVNGLLFLGHADRPDQTINSRFQPYADHGSFVYRKQAACEPVKPPVVPDKPLASLQRPQKAATGVRKTALPPPPEPLGSPPRPQTQSQGTAVATARVQPADRAEPADRGESRRPDLPAPAVRNEPNDAMTQALVLADQGRYDEAAQRVRTQMAGSTLNAPAHFLLGIIYQAAGSRAEAEAELTKAVYLDPEHDEALLALALLARRRGDMAAEATYRRRAERVLTRKGRS